MKLLKAGFEDAQKNLKQYLSPTPLIKNDYLSNRYKCNIYFKLESMQPVGSFKVRGALNKILTLSQSDRDKGVIAVSAGNHSQGVAYASKKLGVKSKIIMPIYAPMIKVQQTKNLGSEVISFGEGVEEGFNLCKEIVEEEKLTFIHPYQDEKVIYGQGTIGFELVKQLKQTDFVFSSIGGGGLISGLLYNLKELSPNTKVVGSQPLGCSYMVDSIIQNELIIGDKADTFADGIKVRKPSQEMYDLINERVDEVVKVSDSHIVKCVLELMEYGRIMAEGASAISLAAFQHLYQQSPRRFHNKNIVLIISGGNIDINTIDRIIEKGLRESGRRVRLTVSLADRPGALSSLTREIASCDANILEIEHNRTNSETSLLESIVDVIVEIRDNEQKDFIKDTLTKRGYQISIK